MKTGKSKINKKTLEFLRKHKGTAGGILAGASVFALDQLAKSAVEARPDSIFPHNAGIFGDRAELQKLHNQGLAFGLGKEHAKGSRAVSEAAALGVLGSLLLPGRSGLVKFGDCLSLGGAFSNIYDRKKRGHVVDYIHIKKGPLSRIVFNLGDAAIAAGAVFELLGSLQRRK